MTKKIKNIELVTLALYEIGGATKSKETEDIAVKADEIDNERFLNISNNSRDHIINNFSKEQMVKKYLNLYEKISIK